MDTGGTIVAVVAAADDDDDDDYGSLPQRTDDAAFD